MSATGTDLLQENRGGFDFSLCKRNEMITNLGKGANLPKAMKTGTTIVGLIYKDGVVLGADTRATEGPIVCDKNCEKIHKISKKIWCCGAGTAADTEAITGLIESQLVLHSMATLREPRVITALTRLKQRLFQYQGYIGAALVLGGVDETGSHLYTVYPHGSTDKLPFATMGSGSLAAMSVFESGYKDNMEEKEAVELVTAAVQSGIFNDLGSGSNVDVCVISKSKGVEMKRNYKTDNERLYRREAGYAYPRGTTEVLAKAKEMMKGVEVTKMDVSA